MEIDRQGPCYSVTIYPGDLKNEVLQQMKDSEVYDEVMEEQGIFTFFEQEK